MIYFYESRKSVKAMQIGQLCFIVTWITPPARTLRNAKHPTSQVSLQTHGLRFPVPTHHNTISTQTISTHKADARGGCCSNMRLTRSTLLPLGALRVAMTFNGATCPTGVAMMGRKARPWIASSRLYLRSLGGTYPSPSPPSLFVLNSMQTPVTQALDPLLLR